MRVHLRLMFFGLMKYEGGCAVSLQVSHPEGLFQHLLRSASAKFCELACPLLAAICCWGPPSVYQCTNLRPRLGNRSSKAEIRPSSFYDPFAQAVPRTSISGLPGPPGPARPQQRSPKNLARLSSGTQYTRFGSG